MNVICTKQSICPRFGMVSFIVVFFKVLPAINSVVVQLQGMDSSPNEIEVTFGINLTIQAGPIAFISAGSETNFGVTVHWTGKAEEPPVVPLDGKSETTANTN